MDAKEINAKLQIVKLKGLTFRQGIVSCTYNRDYAFYVEGMGYLAWNKHFYPYTPIGGKKALQAILDWGGFTDYDGLHFVNPIN